MLESTDINLEAKHRPDKVQVCQADYHNPFHASALVSLLDVYAQDPAGGAKALSEFTKANLVPELAARPQAFSVLAFYGEQPVGLVNCIEGFSTFACRPLVNVHDVAVLAECRGQGVVANAGPGGNHCQRARRLQTDAGSAGRQR